MNSLLLLVLLLLMIIIGGKRGLKSFVTLIINFILLILTFYLIAIGLNPLIVSVLSSILISYIILFGSNGNNIKTRSAFKSVLIVYIILILLICMIVNIAKLGGFSYEQIEEISMFSHNINLNMNSIMIALILLGLIGAITDTSIAISSSLYEVDKNNDLSRKELYKSGLRVGKDILGTTVNTLVFAFIGEFLTLIIWFRSLSYTLGETINSKVFAGELVKMLFSNIGCVLIIPITSYITSYYLYKNKAK